MFPSTKVISLRMPNMVQALSSGKMVPPMMVNGKMTRCMVKASTCGRTTKRGTRASGSMTRWRVAANILGRMVASMKEVSKTINSKEKASSDGLEETCKKVNSRTAKCREEASTIRKKELKEKEFGEMAMSRGKMKIDWFVNSEEEIITI